MINEKYFLPFGLSVAILLARSVISIHYLLYLSNEVHLSAIAFDSMFLPWVVKQSCFFVAPFTGKKKSLVGDDMGSGFPACLSLPHCFGGK